MCLLKFNYSPLGSAVALKTFCAASPKPINHIHIPLVAVDLLGVCNSILSELQNHLGTFPHGLFIAITAGQEVWVLLLEVRVVEDQRFCSDENHPKRILNYPTRFVNYVVNSFIF